MADHKLISISSINKNNIKASEDFKEIEPLYNIDKIDPFNDSFQNNLSTQSKVFYEEEYDLNLQRIILY